MLYAAVLGAFVLGAPTSHLRLEQIPVPKQASPTLIGGDPVTPADYPGVFYTSQGNSRCTGTLIGERVIASAAHCMSNGASLTLKYKGVTYSGKCSHAPEYRGNSTADWALCLLSSPIPDAIGESVNIDPSRPKVGEKIRLMGYGCIRNGGGGGNDGVLRSNLAKVTSVPRGTNYDTVTKDTAALCYGDSGGPSFVYDKDGKRYQLAINSRGDIRTTSYLSTISTAPAVTFYKKWSEANGVKICGLHPDATGCKAEPGPQMPPECQAIRVDVFGVYESCLFAEPAPHQNDCDAVKTLVDACYEVRYP